MVSKWSRFLLPCEGTWKCIKRVKKLTKALLKWDDYLLYSGTLCNESSILWSKVVNMHILWWNTHTSLFYRATHAMSHMQHSLFPPISLFCIQILFQIETERRDGTLKDLKESLSSHWLSEGMFTLLDPVEIISFNYLISPVPCFWSIKSMS